MSVDIAGDIQLLDESHDIGSRMVECREQYTKILKCPWKHYTAISS